MSAEVIAVASSDSHHFSKVQRAEIRLLVGIGVEGDAHAGTTVKHRSRVARDPSRPNLRQVHLIHSELFAEVMDKGFVVRPGDMGENVTTRGVDLLALPAGTRLRLGDEAMVELTGLRNPCSQIDRFQQGLMSAVLARTWNGKLVRKAGVMSVVLRGGWVLAGDRIEVELPGGTHKALQPV